jgi:WD40 repeat protein
MFTYEDCFWTDGQPISHILIVDPFFVIGTLGGTIHLRRIDTLEYSEGEIVNKGDFFTTIAGFKNHLFIGKPNGWVEVWNLTKMELNSRFKPLVGAPHLIAISEEYCAVARERKIEILETNTNRSLGICSTPPGPTHHGVEKMFIQGNNLVWKYYHEEEIHFWNITTFEEEFVFNDESSISTFFVDEDFLLVGTDDCVEMGDDFCTLNIWDLSTMKRITRLGKYQDEFFFDVKVSKHFLVAATVASIDIWEWGTWNHIDRVSDLSGVHHCQLLNDKLLVGDIEGGIKVWKKTT